MFLQRGFLDEIGQSSTFDKALWKCILGVYNEVIDRTAECRESSATTHSCNANPVAEHDGSLISFEPMLEPMS